MHDSLLFLKDFWHLTDIQPAPNKSYNDVYFAKQSTHEHRDVVLKICLEDVYDNEKHALIAFHGYGCVNLLDSHDNHNALLIDHIHPGTSLKLLFPEKDELAINITCALLQKLHKAPIPSNHHYPHLSDWLHALDKSYNNSPSTLAEHLPKARKMRDHLFGAPQQDVLLHGDFHHDNILLNEACGHYIAIDPKGILGDPAYDTAVFMFNPLPTLLTCHHAIDILHQRIVCFSKNLGLDASRIHAFAYVHAVLSACWSIQDNEDPSYSLTAADILEKIQTFQ